jgi:hypothetical protein
MSERMKRIVAILRERVAARGWAVFDTTGIEALEILSSEVDALMHGFDRMENLARGGSAPIHNPLSYVQGADLIPTSAVQRANRMADLATVAELNRRCQKAETDVDAWRTAAESALRELQDLKKPIKTDSPALFARTLALADAVRTFFHAHTHTVAAGHWLVPDQDMVELKDALDKFDAP